MADSILDIKGVHVAAGCFADGVDFDLFGDGGNSPHRTSIVFGRNGSGKTTVANCISKTVSGAVDCAFFYDNNNQPLQLPEGSRVRVFAESYIREKVLVEHDGLEAIVMLGDQVSAKTRIYEIDKELVALGKAFIDLQHLEEDSESGPNSLDKLEKAAKERAKSSGWSERRAEIDGGKPNLTPARWDSILKAKPAGMRKDLEDEFGSLLEQYKRVGGSGEIIEWRMPAVDRADYDEEQLIALLSEVLDQPELSEREKRLLELARSGSQALIETARDVFSREETTHCPMCQQGVTPEYKDALLSSISNVLNKRADEFKGRLEAAELCLLALDEEESFPPQLSGEVLAEYTSAVMRANGIIARCNSLLSQRKASLYVSIEVAELGLSDAISKVNMAAAAINSDIDSLNAAISGRENLKTRLYCLNDQIAYIDASDTIAKHDAAAKKLDETRARIREIKARRRALDDAKGEQGARLRRTEIALSAINRFLATVYFDTARFRLVPFGAVYKIESYGKPVAPKDISTGERNILALCYFFSEGGKGKFEGSEDSDPQYLVIDDPISSFDMENRVGICSLLRERIAHVLGACDDSRVTVLTHDAATVDELEHVFNDIKGEFKSRNSDFKSDVFELASDGTRLCSTNNRKAQYSVLLKRVYDYAVADECDETESYLIGNVMRRVMEGYSTFNYGMDMAMLSRDSGLKVRFDGLEGLLSNAMYRLVLNDDSHMKERVSSLNPTLTFERYSEKEKKQLARCVLVILNRLDSEHVKKHLGGMRVSLNEIEDNLLKWESCLSVGE